MNPESSPLSPSDQPQSQVHSLQELIDLVSGRSMTADLTQEDSGLAELLPFPFLALVGQSEMKLALLLAVINPGIGGILLVGPRGTGKTTAVRSLINLLPQVQRSACFYGCLPEDIEMGGMDEVCPDCAKKYGQGLPLTKQDGVRLVELPLNARLEDVIGGLDDRAALHERLRLRRGILAHADLNVLYIDEVNLLGEDIVNAILDAAAQGIFTVRRGAVAASYRARFTLIGSMNPEEGRLRPQIMDRFGLRVVVHGLTDSKERLEAYQRVQTYQKSPRRTVAGYASETDLARKEIQAARDLLPAVILPPEIARAGIALIQTLQIDSLRAEISLFESARALAAADNRAQVEMDDLRTVAPIALRMRRSSFMTKFFSEQSAEDDEMKQVFEKTLKDFGQV
jgi:magnesium chelatase subunit I